MRVPTFTLILCVIAALAPVGATQITPELREAMEAAAPGEAIDAYLVMADQLRLADFADLTSGTAPRERRALVADRLKSHAGTTQVAARALLDEAVAAGTAADVRVLWMGNALLFSAEPAVLARLAALPGVDRIQVVVDHGAEAYQDVPAPMPMGIGTYPLFDDFESGVLEPHWTAITTGEGYVEVSSANDPEGAFHLLMASLVDGVESLASITVELDLTGETDVGIRFRHKEFGDENDPEDGVFVSEDGVTFFEALTLNEASSLYETKTIQLDDVIAAHGLSYTSTFQIRFQWSDNFNIPTDGFAFDTIEIAPGVGEPPPAVPEPNIVGLQAPELWDIGIRGEGVLVGNIDSGMYWTHPDLINRVWSNPGEIDGNSLDDDNNGFVDDMHGWDFLTGTADITSGDSHGTKTAGIAVGDGTSGRATGMAPGASIVACEISGETLYWQAQQYLLDVGVDVITSSYSYKWPNSPKPDYHMHRQMCEMELAAGIIHANSIGNQGGLLSTYPIPFNISAPGNCPSPFLHPEQINGGLTSVMGCGGITLPNDDPYTSSGLGPAAWEDITLYEPTYPHVQDPAAWDFPYGGFGGGQQGLLKPDVVAYTVGILTTTIGSGYSTFGGTSAATPHLGGAMALLRSAQPEALPRHIAAAIQLTAVDLGSAGKDSQFGAGKIQVFDAARRLVLLVRAETNMPSIGTDITLDIFGEPNALAGGYFGGTIQQLGVDWNLTPPFFPLGFHQLDANGEISLTFGLPNDPVLVGISAFIQFGHTVMDTVSWGIGPMISVPEAITIVN